MARQLSERLNIRPEQIDVRRPFRDYGLDSLTATRIAADLARELGRSLPATLLFDQPNIESLAASLAGESASAGVAGGGAHARVTNEPIAIVGLACRFPRANNAAEFWRMLCDGVDAISETPPDRWDAAAYHDPDPAAPGKIVTRRGGFLDNVDRFDAGFFGISPREAAFMDPQQRLMLELSWESLEDAGIPSFSLRDSRTGVYFGVVWRDYAELQALESVDPTQHAATGHSGSIIANRVSYTFGLRGPSLTVDTACSSSLVAVHQACQSLRSGECDAALAGGVMLLLSPKTSVAVSAFGGLSPDGRCATFAADANGYVRGEGAGIVVLKRLSDALADGNPIYCVIRGSAVNNDGATNGLTAPSVQAQQAVLAEAYAGAGIDPSDADYVELHGTGTALGDPMEARALGAVLCAERDAAKPLIAGSVKTNIGHLEGAAGIAGLIKLALAIRHGAIPPSLHFHRPSPHIDFDGLRLRVQTSLGEWPSNGHPRTGGVSSFGFGGTNCHVVLQQAPARTVVRAAAPVVAPLPSKQKVAFLFCGAGPVWPGMGRDLLATDPVFRAKLSECDRILRSIVGWSLIDELLAPAEASRFNRAEVQLPLMFAMQVALAARWESQGVVPAAVVGYSIGEWAAAHAAGAITLEQGLAIACAYAKALRPVSGKAGMAVIGLAAGEVRELIGTYGGALAISADNGGGSTGVGGDLEALRAFTASLPDSVFRRIIDIDCYAHIPQVEPLTAELAAGCAGLEPAALNCPMVSTVTGTWVLDGELSGKYWVDNFREPVAFVPAMEKLAEAGIQEFVEVSPHPAHGRDISNVMRVLGKTAEVFPSMQKSNARLSRGGGSELLVLSAHTEKALREMSAAIAQRVSDSDSLRNVCYTAAIRRSHLDHRLAVAGDSVAELARKLNGFADGERIRGVSYDHVRAGRKRKLAFVFSGQGTLRPSVARQLLRDEQVFREALVDCERYIRRHGGWSLFDELESAARFEDTEIAQPVQFAIQVGLAALLRHWGIEPDGVTGHSVGEYAAAYTAGMLSLEDAVRAVCARGRLMHRAAGLGAMASVAAAAAAVGGLLESAHRDLVISAVNSPAATVVSGDTEAVATFVSVSQQAGIAAQRLPVKYAFHSPQMARFQPELVRELSDVAFRSPRLPFYSTVSGVRQHDVDAQYWGRNLREPVRFAAAIESMSADDFDVFLEVSPHSVLQRAISETLVTAGRDTVVVPSLRSGADERAALLEAAGALHTAGLPVAFDRLFPNGGSVVPLVPYPWQRERAWIPARGRVLKGLDGGDVHPLLGARIRSAGQTAEFECEISGRAAGPLADHQVYGSIVAPGASHIARMITAVHATFGSDHFELRDVAFPEALVIRPDESRTVHAVIGDDGCRVASLSDNRWTTHASCRVDLESSAPAAIPAHEHQPPREMAASDLYEWLWNVGLHLGPQYRWVEEIWRGEREVLGRMRRPTVDDEFDGGLIPGGLIDSCFQLLGAAESFEIQDGIAFVPISVDAVRWFGLPEGRLWCRLTHRPGTGAGGTAVADLQLFSESGTVALEIAGLTVKRAPRDLFLRERGGLYHQVEWAPAPADSTAARAVPGRWLIVGDGEGLAGQLAGADCTVVSKFDAELANESFDRVVYVAPRPAAAPTFEAAQEQICGEFLRLAQSIIRADTPRRPRLFAVTHGDIQHAPLHGLAHALSEEHPELSCVCVDLDPSAEDLAGALAVELAVPAHQPRVAWRAGKRMIPKLVPATLPSSGERAPSIDQEASYLITGGLGGLGLEVARWLVEQGARHITLMGRSAPSGASSAFIREKLESAGAFVTIVRGDVCNRADVQRAIACCSRPIKGVIHAAGVLDDGVVLDQDWTRFWNVMAPKVDGAWNLHEATKDVPLDWFVLFSSAASILPAPGQSNYAAANAFLDAFAHYRHSLGLPATAINWGPWAETGMAARLGTHGMRSWLKRGLQPFSTHEGLDALSNILAAGVPSMAVLRIAKPVARETTPARVPKAAKSDLTAQLAVATPQVRRDLIERLLHKQTASILGLDETKPIDPLRPLRDLGFDSLMAVEFRNALAGALGRSLPATLLFDYPSLSSLSEFLFSEYKEAPLSSPKPASVKAKTPPSVSEDSIAIVGMACRFPGGADTPERYWQNLRDGIDAITEVPRDRWDLDSFFDSNPDAAGKMYSRWGGFVANVDQFDPGFFGIAPREARGMDPQQRLLLEVAWEALERAGVPASKLAGTDTGVFLGFCLSDYGQLQLYAADPSGIDAYSGTGSVGSVAAGRLSYVLGLQGPCISVDTACSSSLVSVHLACQSIRKGECDTALAGGVNMLISPNISVYFSRLTALSPDGRCKAFDASANGYVRGEGCGLIVLKRLSRAIVDGDRIIAVIRGSAVNQDGRSNGLTAPNGKAQEQVLRRALADARLDPDAVSYVEAHGTGTPLGDPIEVGALAAALGAGRNGNKLRVGSVKTNIGHLEGAAGIAGLMKAALMLQNRQLPPTLHVRQLNPYIPWQDVPVQVQTSLEAWTVPDGVTRIAGVSSFGFSGTNAHIILEEAPAALSAVTEAAIAQLELAPAAGASGDAPVQAGDARAHVFALSAKTPAALSEPTSDAIEQLEESPAAGASGDAPVQAGDARAHVFALSAKTSAALNSLTAAAIARLESATNSSAAAFCYTSTVRRTHHEHRIAVAGRSVAEIADALRSATPRHVAAGSRPKLAFIFSGHGSQWLGMGRELLAHEPIFRESIERCASALRRYVDWSLLDQLNGDPTVSRLSESDVAQPAIFAVQVSLAALWRSWGIEPDAVAGHSSGEIAAAHVAGVLDLDDAARIVCHRTRLVKAAAGRGAMLAVDLAPEQAAAALNGGGRPLWIAAVNSPSAVVLSGEVEAVEELRAKLDADGVYCRRVDVDYASHCPMMDPFRDELTRTLRGLPTHSPVIPIYSTVSGQLSGAEDFTPEYWGQHLRGTVRFREAIDEILGDGYGIFLCADPHPVLAQPLAQCIESAAKPAAVVASLRRNQDALLTLQRELANLHTLGYPIDWTRQFPAGESLADLPTYPWQHERFWVETPRPKPSVRKRQAHPLLGERVRAAVSTALFETELSLAALPLLADHRAYGVPVVAGACHLAMALCAARELMRTDAVAIRNASFPRALALREDEPTTVQIALTPQSDSSYSFEVHSLDGDTWQLHASGVVERSVGNAPGCSTERGDSTTMQAGVFYQDLRDQGVDYGPAFRWIDALWQGTEGVLGSFCTPDGEQAAGDYVLHPGLIDSWFQLLRAVPVLANDDGDPVVPVAVDSLSVFARPEGQLWGRVSWAAAGGAAGTFTGNLTLFDETGRCIAEARGLTAKRAPRELFLRSTVDIRDWLYETSWRPAALPVAAPALGNFVLLADSGEFADAIAERLRAAGANCTIAAREDWVRSVNDPATDSLVYLGAPDGRLLDVIKALQRSPRLWLVTSNIEEAPLRGIGLSLREEKPGLECIQVDVDEVDDLVQELLHGGDEDRVWWREGRRYAARLTKAPAAAPVRELRFDAEGQYLITGGLGALGLKAAEWMVQRGARNLLLIGRGTPSETAARKIQTLEAVGARVTVERADVTLRSDLERALAGRRFRGVIHAAGILDDGVLEQISWERFHRVLSVKMDGARNLHELTAGQDLDFFVLFSSATSVIGSAGQANHAAGNAYLDALAHHRRTLGLPALSINWGPWSEIGQAAEKHERLSQLGIGAIAPDRGIEALEYLLRRDSTQTLVLPVDWKRWPRPSKFLSEVVQPEPANAQPLSAPAQDFTADAVKSAAPEQRASMLRDGLRRELASVLQLQPAAIEGERVLLQYGLDSLMALELRRRIDRKLGVSVPLAKLLGGLTLDGLAELVTSEFANVEPAESGGDQWVEIEL